MKLFKSLKRIGSAVPAQTSILQRVCDCGGTPGPTGKCAECQKKRLQRKAQNSELETRNDSSVPKIVYEVLHSPGQPLDSKTLAFMGPRFGHDWFCAKQGEPPASSRGGQSHSI